MFSKYIRNRGAVDGWNRCFTCNHPFRVEDLDCGHFLSRRHHSIRWNEQNAFPQCRECNRIFDGRADVYEFYLRDFGVDVDELKRLARKPEKFSLSELEEMINHFKSKTNENS